MSNSKRLLSVFLICALIFSALSGTISSLAAAPEVDSANYTRMEAETFGTPSLHFNPNLSNSVNASGGKVHGGLNCDFDKMQTLDSLSEYLDKTNTAYVTFAVDVPADGVYSIKPGYQVGKNEGVSDTDFANYLANYEMAILVNDHEVYTSDFVASAGDALSNDSSVDVTLYKGRNVIRMIPVTYEQREFKRHCWLNIDYLDIPNTVTAIAKEEPEELSALNAEYIRNYNTTTGTALAGDCKDAIFDAGNTYANFDVSTINNYSFFSYTVDVEKAGYYDISLTFKSGMTTFTNTLDPVRHGYMVNGVPYEAWAVRSTDNGKNNVDNNRLDLTTYLNAGSNVLLITCNIASDKDSKETLYWTDWGTLMLYGAKQAAEKIDPSTVVPERVYTTLPAESFAAGFNYDKLVDIKFATPVKKGDVNYVQSFENMVATSSLQKTGLPYVTYMVKTGKAGKYFIRQNVTMHTPDANNYDGYFSVISVNDKQFHKVENYVDGYNTFELEVELEAGVNIIRCIANTKETYAMNYNVEQVSLEVVKPLKGVVADVKEYGPNAVTKNTRDVMYSTTNFNGVVNYPNNASRQFLTKFADTGLTFDGINQMALEKLPYIAKTVDVPSDGYYDISFHMFTGFTSGATASDAIKEGMGNGSVTGATGYVVARVDGEVTKFDFVESILPGNSTQAKMDNTTAVNAMMYLTKGTHTIMFSAPMDYKNAATGVEKFYHCAYLHGIVTNGLAESATQVDPYDVPDTVDENTVTNHLEAEIFGTSIGFAGNKTGLDGYSARGAIAGISADASALQSKAELTANLDKANNPMVTFIVKAEKADVYNFTPVYFFSGNTAGYKATVLVNDKTAYDCDFVQADGKDAGWNSGSVDISLDAGVNVIRVIPFTADNASYYVADSFNVDYAVIEANDSTATDPCGVLPKTTELNAALAPYISGFSQTGAKLSGVRDMAASGLSIETLTSKYLTEAAYFSYTVNAPVNGYYDITLPYNVGAKAGGSAPTEADRYFKVFVDNAVSDIKFSKNGDGAINASVYLKKGNHALTYIAQLPATTAGIYGETTFTKLIVSGGLTVAETAINPLSQNRMEAEKYGITSTYGAKESSGGYSGGLAYGNGVYGAKYDVFKSDEEMLAGNYNKGIANVEFTVISDADATKQIRVGYKFGGDQSTDKAKKALEDIVAEKEGKMIYMVVIKPDGTKKGYPIADNQWVDVELGNGENKIVVSTFSTETYEKYLELGGTALKIWTNIDYIDIDDGLVKVLPKSEVAVIAEAEEFAEVYNFRDTEKSNGYSGGMAVSQGGYNYTNIPTEEQYRTGSDVYYLKQPHTLYTVEAEVDGTYSLSSGFRFGTEGKVPDEIHTYIIVIDSDNVTTVYQQNGANTWVDVQLKKGKSTVITTIFDKETYQKTMGAGQGHTWVNMDYLGLYSKAFEDMETSGLEYAIRPLMPEGALPVDSENYTRFEAETDAYYDGYTDQYKFGAFSEGYGRSVPSGLYFNAQTKAQIEASGINRVVTPSVTFYVNVEKDGMYEVVHGLSYAALGEDLPANKKAYVAISANGQTFIRELEVTNTRTRFVTLTSNLQLKAGLNKITITCATRDSIPADELSSVVVYHDYMDIKDLNATVTAPRSYIEAEESKLRGYTQKYERGSGPSGKDHGYAGGEAFGKIVSSALTLDKLNSNWDYLAYASYVEYTVIAPEAGVYPVEFLGWTGWGGNPKTHEVFVGVSVNESKFTKVEFRVYGTLSAHFSRVYDIELKEGENKIILTCMLFDVVNSAGNLYWVDHDCIVLPEGVGTVVVEPFPEWVGDDQMHVHDDLFIIDASRVKPSYTITVDEDGNIVGSTDTSKPGSPQTGEGFVVAIPMLIAFIAVGGMALIAEKKRRQRC